MAALIDDFETESAREWIELSRPEAIGKIEQIMTRDLVTIEIEYGSDVTPIGNIETFTWIMNTDSGEQRPVLLSMKDPARPDAPLRWFVHVDLVATD